VDGRQTTYLENEKKKTLVWIQRNANQQITETIMACKLRVSQTLQKLIYKHTADSKNVQRNKKKEKLEFIGCQVSTN
jgi:hypothetical protein